MNRTHRALSCISWTLLLVGVAMAPVVVGPGAAAVANEDARPSAYAVEQNGQCIPMTPIGDASANVTDHYDYRSEGSGFSSHGTTDLQVENVSQLYVYRGSAGDSLVVLHDRFDENAGGGSVSMTFTGVPEAGTWPVVDDDYDEPDDQYDTNGTEHTMHWMWAPNRTDGGALRGVAERGYDGIQIDATFGNGSYGAEEREPPWPYATNNMSWAVRNGEGDLVSLEEDADVTFRRGDCSPPQAALSASPDSTVTGETVTFDASDSSDGGEIVEYHWDVDGDGAVDAVTDEPTHEHSYANEGTVTAGVTVFDNTDRNATAETTVEVSANEPPTASLSAPDSSTTDDPVTLDASASSDDGAITEYRWDLDGDGTVDDTTPEAEYETVYDEAGEYTPRVTVVDSAGQTDSDDATVTITEADDPPTAALSAPDSATVNESVTLDASDSTDDNGVVRYEWDVDGDGATENETTAPSIDVSFETEGEYTPVVTVVDTANQSAEATTTINVTRQSFSTSLSANRTTVAPGEAIAFDAEPTPASLADGYRYTFSDGEDATGETPVHAYDEPGDYTVTVNVSSTDGRHATDSIGVSVEAEESSTPGDGDDGDDGDDENAAGGGGGAGGALEPPGSPSINLTGATLDSTAVDPGRSVSVTVEVENSGDGDGTTRLALTANGETVETMNVFVGENSTERYRIDHTFEEPGEYALFVNGTSAGTVRVAAATDAPGAVGDTESVRLVDVASPSDAVGVGEPTRIDAILENRGGQAVTVNVTLRVEGDVASVETVTIPAGDERTVSFNRTFASAGEYQVSVDGTNRTVLVGDGGPAGTPGDEGSGENSGPGNVLLFGIVGVVAVVATVLGLSRWI